MNKYLVVSYDGDEQQWFYDIVFAESGEAAVRRICEDVRPYVIAADYSDAGQMKRMNTAFQTTTKKDSEQWLREAKQ